MISVDTEVSCIQIAVDFSGNRVSGQMLMPTNWRLTFEMVPTEASEEGVVNRGEIAYEKLKFWIDYVLDGIIVASQDSELAGQLSYITENPVVMTPMAPSDSHLLQLLHAKFRAIVGDDLHIQLMTLTNMATGTVCKFNTDEQMYALPEGDDYMEDLHFDTPWWHRKTMDFADFTNEEVAMDKDIQEYISHEDPLVEFERELLRSYSEVTDRKPRSAEIIKMPKKWTPKIV